jgi:nucleotide-binding universal stress UspA family protein
MMIRSLVVALDMEEGSESLLEAALQLAQRTDATVHVVHAAPEDRLPYPGRKATHEQRQQDLEEQVREMLGRAGAASAPTSVHVASSSPYRAVTDRAREVGADLIVLGPHSRRAIGDRMLGSTADRVIRTSGVPCLVLRGPLPDPLTRVLVPIDFSPGSRRAFHAAADWINDLGTGSTILEALHVVPEVYVLQREPVRPEVVEPSLNSEVSRIRETATLRHGEVRQTVLSGEVADTILRRAEEGGADLLAISTHGGSDMDRVLIGSVAAKVIRRAMTALLLVPPEEAAAD